MRFVEKLAPAIESIVDCGEKTGACNKSIDSCNEKVLALAMHITLAGDVGKV